MLIQRSSCGLKIPPQEVLAFRKFYRKEVLAACRIQAQATRKKPQEVAGLRTQKEVLARALFLGCTVVKFKELSPDVDENPTTIPAYPATAQELVSNLSGLLSSALTEGTLRLYQRVWVVFRQFYAQFYRSPNPTLALSAVCLPLYISYLSFRKLVFSTITLHLSAISYVHKLRGFCDPAKLFLIQKLLTALSCQRHSEIRLLITRPVLNELVRSLEYTNSSAFYYTLFSAMFLAALNGLF